MYCGTFSLTISSLSLCETEGRCFSRFFSLCRLSVSSPRVGFVKG